MSGPTANQADALGRIALGGLAGQVQLGAELARGPSRVLQLSACPDLDRLDLAGCPRECRIELAEDAVPNELVLPENARCLHLRLRDRWPVAVCHGHARQVLIEIEPGGALDEVQGLYSLGPFNGLRTMVGVRLERTRGIDHYLRIDQSRRGLQHKELSQNRDPNRVSWRLYEPQQSLDSIAAVLLALDDDRLSALAWSTSRTAAAERRALLRPRPTTLEAPGTVPVSAIEALVILRQRGLASRTAWALRCWLQQATRSTAELDRLGAALLEARPQWSVKQRLRRIDRVLGEDLELFFLCADSGLTRRYSRHLAQVQSPLDLAELAGLVAMLPGDRPLRHQLLKYLRKGLADLLARVRSSRNNGHHHPIGRYLYLDRETVLKRLIIAIGLLDDPEAFAQARAVAAKCREPKSCIDAGIELLGRGVPGGRLLVADVLSSGTSLAGKQREEALAIVLGSQ